jgi:hypothetical protein
MIFACAVGLRIVLRALSKNEGFMISLVVFSFASLLVGFWIVMMQERDRKRAAVRDADQQ